MRVKETMKNKIMHGKEEGKRNRGRPRTIYIDDIRDWTGMDLTKEVRRTEDRKRWKKVALRWVHQQPTRLRL